jgi:hypothetical protein
MTRTITPVLLPQTDDELRAALTNNRPPRRTRVFIERPR